MVFEGKDLIALADDELRRIRGNEIAMIFQDPLSSLHPFYKVGKQLVGGDAAPTATCPRRRRATRAVELLELVGIPDPHRRVDQYPHEFSGGMRQRAMIAMALANEPKLLIADEPTTALDVTVQAQILALLEDLQQRLGMAIIIITHDLGVVAEMADEIAVMYAGRIVEHATSRAIFAAPAAPVHVGPAEVDPAPGPGPRRGAGPDRRPAAELINRPSGCHFHPRCPYVQEDAQADRPAADAGARRARPRGRLPAGRRPSAPQIWEGLDSGQDPDTLRHLARASARPRTRAGRRPRRGSAT